MNHVQPEAGSFRDRNNQVFYRDGSVFRALSPTALAAWETLRATRFFTSFHTAGKIVQTERVHLPEMPSPEAGIPWAGCLKHETIPFISYPYEWPFGMLKDAALLHLELLQAALSESLTLKDASAYNVQWVGARPVFIDVTSFEPLAPGEPWIGYRQFCALFLYPLILEAYRGIPFRPWLRGSIDGISSADCARMMSARDLFRPGVLLHVALQNRLQGQYADTKKEMKADLRAAGFNRALIEANVQRLHRLITGLTWGDAGSAKSEWSEYADHNSYDAADRQAKQRFVRTAVQSQERWRLVWDLGANTGDYSRIAAENANTVVAMDADALAIERLYRKLKGEANRTILPLVMNVADPSPNLGWRGLERKGLVERGRPDLVLCLALIHHVVISANIPMRDFVAWLAGLGASLVIEFVTKDDPMTRTLLRNKVDQYPDYDLLCFEKTLADAFDIHRREALASGTRVLYFAQSKSSR